MTFAEYVQARDLMEFDGTRERRQRDPQRQKWYAQHRQKRFAKHMGFPTPSSADEEKKKEKP